MVARMVARMGAAFLHHRLLLLLLRRRLRQAEDHHHRRSHRRRHCCPARHRPCHTHQPIFRQARTRRTSTTGRRCPQKTDRRSSRYRSRSSQRRSRFGWPSPPPPARPAPPRHVSAPPLVPPPSRPRDNRSAEISPARRRRLRPRNCFRGQQAHIRPEPGTPPGSLHRQAVRSRTPAGVGRAAHPPRSRRRSTCCRSAASTLQCRHPARL